MTIRVVARLTAKPEKVAEMRAALEACIEPTRAEKGCILYELMQNNADPTDFTFVEEWDSDEALDVHLQTEHIRELQGKADDLFANPPDIRRYSLLQ
ncbi:MAG TPA: putative quinol monooxygenase [Pyrinomonadaceae bacterium]|nr:putative quinol monooxygenase [Pyrinomonadaceae bacterium]